MPSVVRSVRVRAILGVPAAPLGTLWAESSPRPGIQLVRGPWQAILSLALDDKSER